MLLFEKYLLALLLLGTSLAFNPLLNTEAFEYPKLIALVVLGGVLTVVNILAFWNKPMKWRFSLEWLFLGLILLSQVLAFVFSANQDVALIGRGMRYQGLLTEINYLLVFFNSYLFFKKYRDEETRGIFHWLIFLLLAACAMALVGYSSQVIIFDPVLFYDRVFGSFGNPNYLASFLIVLLPLYVIAYRPRPSRRLVDFFVGLIVIVGTLFLTGCRSAWIASIAGFGFWGLLEFWRRRNFRVLGVTALLVVVVGALVFAVTNGDGGSRVVERLSVKSENLNSLDTRISMWGAGFELSLDSPVFGYGQDSIQDHIDPYLPDDLRENEVFYVDRTHSELIDLAVTVGYFGLAAYLGFFLVVLWRAVRKYDGKDLYFAGALIGLITIHIYQLVNFSTISTNVLIYFLAGYLVVEVSRKGSRTS